MQLPIKTTPLGKCDRCGLMYPKKEAACTHCADLTDREVIALQEKYESYTEGNANLGLLLVFFAAVLAVGTFIVWLSMS